MHFRMRVGFFVVFLVGIPLSSAVWAYSGGSGTPRDPFKIAHADDLMLLGATPSDYHGHFVLVSDIDLDPNRPGGRVFEQALIAPIRNINLDPRFWGNFDGNGHVLRNIVFVGDSYLGLHRWYVSPPEVAGRASTRRANEGRLSRTHVR